MKTKSKPASLHEFVQSYGYSGVEQIVDAICRSLQRYAISPSRVEVRTRLEYLSLACRNTNAALERLQEEMGGIERAFEIAEVHAWRRENKRLPSIAQLRAQIQSMHALRLSLREIADASGKTATSLRAEKREHDDRRTALGYELASYYVEVTGDQPTASKAATVAKPGTPFGRFVALALAACPQDSLARDEQIRLRALGASIASFLNNAKDFSRVTAETGQ